MSHKGRLVLFSVGDDLLKICLGKVEAVAAKHPFNAAKHLFGLAVNGKNVAVFANDVMDRSNGVVVALALNFRAIVPFNA